MKQIDLTGKRYGKLTVLKFAYNRKGNYYWHVQCGCGNNRIMQRGSLRNGRRVSCGCIKGHHNMSYTPTYKAWCTMKQRCNNPKDRRYKDYGGRDIQVCRQWLEEIIGFETFLQDMGVCPPNKSLDRIDNNSNYEPLNCRWATRQEQQSNRRTNRIIEFHGQKKTQTQWERLLGFHKNTLATRLRRGWSTQRAFTHPIRCAKYES